MKCIIVDDESLARQRLIKLLSELDFVEVCGEASSGEDALALAEKLNPDVVLLDIRMPGMDGIEAARHLNKLEPVPAVIFTTAYGEHALEAFEAHAIDYLLKPIDRTRLCQALEKAQRLSVAQLDELGAAASGSSARTQLCARVRGNLELIPVGDILYLLADNKYVTVRTHEGEMLIEESLKALEEEFSGRFIRIHRKALVSVTAIRGLEKDSQGRTCMVMTGIEDQLEVSRRLLPEVRRLLKSGQKIVARQKQKAARKEAELA